MNRKHIRRTGVYRRGVSFASVTKVGVHCAGVDGPLALVAL